jgi:hypothetical protein
LLNERGTTSGGGKRFSRLKVRKIRIAYNLKDRFSRLRTRGLLSLEEIAVRLNVCSTTIKLWRRAGLLRAHRYDDRSQYLFEPPGPDAPIKHKWKMRTKSKASMATSNALNV